MMTPEERKQRQRYLRQEHARVEAAKTPEQRAAEEHARNNPLPFHRPDPWVKRVVFLGALVAETRDAAFADADAPVGLIQRCEEWAAILQGVADLVRGRMAMRELEAGEGNGQ